MSEKNIQQKQTFVQSGNEIAVQFCNTERMYWLETVTKVYEMFHDNQGDLPIQVVRFDFDERITSKDIKPFHLVTLACLIHYLYGHEYKVYVSKNNEVSEYIYNDLGFLSIGGEVRIMWRQQVMIVFSTYGELRKKRKICMQNE